jgi:FtsP/CotA-like multicopper oxidase with cupredoxin domain
MSLITRRDLLLLALKGGSAWLLAHEGVVPADEIPILNLRIAPVQIDIAPGRSILTTAYNGSVPGPLLRLRDGVPVRVEITNETDRDEYVHWHGLLVSSSIDGAAEEKSLTVPAHGKLNYLLTPQPAGVRYVHSHAMAGHDLTCGTYSGQFGFVFVEPKEDPGRYDQEVFLATHEWEPYLTNDALEEEAQEPIVQQAREQQATAAERQREQWEVGYKMASINGKALGHGEPLRVREGQYVLFHVLNASATENVRLSLPEHRFRVVSLDGNPVPKQALVGVLELGVGERVDAVVEMRTPGVWIFGSNDDILRERGMGIVVEYAGKTGAPEWKDPKGQDWNYSLFSNGANPGKVDEVLSMVIDSTARDAEGFEHWLINGSTYQEKDEPMVLTRGRRYRFSFRNNTDDAHPLHFHRSRFELVSVNGKRATGLAKDVFVVKPFGTAEVDLAPAEVGLMLFHCHNQLHMDSGFKMLFKVT